MVDLIEEFYSFNCTVDVYDPWADKEEVEDKYGISIIKTPIEGSYDVVILAVAHDEFVEAGAEQIRKYGKDNHVLYDIKYVLSSSAVDGRL